MNILGSPDNGVIFASYIGSFLMAGGYLAIGSALSALTKNQVIAFVLDRRGVLPLHGQRLDRGFSASCRNWAPAGLQDAIAFVQLLQATSMRSSAA